MKCFIQPLALILVGFQQENRYANLLVFNVRHAGEVYDPLIGVVLTPIV